MFALIFVLPNTRVAQHKIIESYSQRAMITLRKSNNGESK
jgi:hypothetical protein